MWYETNVLKIHPNWMATFKKKDLQVKLTRPFGNEHIMNGGGGSSYMGSIQNWFSWMWSSKSETFYVRCEGGGIIFWLEKGITEVLRPLNLTSLRL